ncbi:DUF695 domain-containing protein [Hahella sp. KA22]|uniref:DUF695 domain-containing protein n=1 Tax=Hahella sp. KA22 TaxID=1628392 RepID=UPI000FDD7846|nr:DUF695 domain-containing protein [Hahella sp. KA22]AZZ92360.1 DUF695 domain-containing protein [Hahella sp. KA22]QAY55733.1 DUF695 domain-containing protein [Hahella sp. KA22]
MQDNWSVYPKFTDEGQAWVSVNLGYEEIARTDARDSLLAVKLKLKRANAQGLPTSEEFAALEEIDEALFQGLDAHNAVYAGRISVNHERYFFYYMNCDEEIAAAIIRNVGRQFGYTLEFGVSAEPEKQSYWRNLYPSEDDWQVIQDLEVLQTLAKSGDQPDIQREVTHWACFPTQAQAQQFADWAAAEHYVVSRCAREEDGDRFQVIYSHTGSMRLDDISFHTMFSNRKAHEHGGDYDGWETSVEKGAPAAPAKTQLFTGRPTHMIGSVAIASLAAGGIAGAALFGAVGIASPVAFSLGDWFPKLAEGALMGIFILFAMGIFVLTPLLLVLRFFGYAGPFFVYAISLLFSVLFMLDEPVFGVVGLTLSLPAAFIFCRFAYARGQGLG